MSAYIVDANHIRAIALWAVERSRNGYMRVQPEYVRGFNGDVCEAASHHSGIEIAQEYADILYNANIDSVQSRYPHESFDDLPGMINKPEFVSISMSDMARRMVDHPVAILKMCDALEYQSCESETWPQSFALSLLNSIRRAAIRELEGYDDAPWEYHGGYISRDCNLTEAGA